MSVGIHILSCEHLAGRLDARQSVVVKDRSNSCGFELLQSSFLDFNSTKMQKSSTLTRISRVVLCLLGDRFRLDGRQGAQQSSSPTDWV